MSEHMHVCTVCHSTIEEHSTHCPEGCYHWPSLCCPGCDCGSFELGHRELEPDVENFAGKVDKQIERP